MPPIGYTLSLKHAILFLEHGLDLFTGGIALVLFLFFTWFAGIREKTREKERETEKQTDTHTDRHTDSQTDRHSDSWELGRRQTELIQNRKRQSGTDTYGDRDN